WEAYVQHWITGEYAGVIVGFMSAVFALIAIFFTKEDVIGLVGYMSHEWERYRDKADILISYTISDHPWTTWIEQQLIQAGYSRDKVIPRDWKASKNGEGTNFKKEMREATKDAKYIISVVSPKYLDPIRSNEDWYHDFKRRISRGRNIFIRIDAFALDEPL